MTGRSFSFLPGVNGGHHDISHHQNNAAQLDRYEKINVWHVEQYGYMLQRMKEIKEGSGTLLDEFVAALRLFEPGSHATDDVQPYLWGKHCLNAVTCASAMAMLPLAELVSRDDIRTLCQDLHREVISVALAEGVEPREFDGFNPMAFSPGAPPEPAH